jgi:hypothetical protein
MKPARLLDDTKIQKKSNRCRLPMTDVSPNFGNQPDSCSIHDMHMYLNIAVAKSLLWTPGYPISPHDGEMIRQFSDTVKGLEGIAKAYAILLSRLSTEESEHATSCIYDVVLAQLSKNEGKPDNIDGDSNARRGDQLKEQAQEITEMIKKKILSSHVYCLNDAPNMPLHLIDDNIACASFEETNNNPKKVVEDDETADKEDEFHKMIRRGYFTQIQHRGLVPNAFLASLAQMRPCEMQESDRVGPYRDLPQGLIGFCCPYCRGQPDNGRYFPSDMKHLRSDQYDYKLLRHFTVQCPQCPPAIRNTIVRWTQEDAATPVKRSHASQAAVLRYVWEQLESTDARELAAAANSLH